MCYRYLLYIDILGFADLVETAPEKVDDVYQIVESLNVHKHGVFSTVTFSDTIVIHNASDPEKDDDHRYIVMYQCEFAKDLMHRLAGRGVSFRAVLMYGAFEHYRLNDRPYYYGLALNSAYRAEKNLKITGLLMDNHCHHYSHIFHTSPFKNDLHYVFVTQALETFEYTYGARTPLPKIIISDTDFGWHLGPELEILRFSAVMAREHPDRGVRDKHQATLAQYRARYPQCFAALEDQDFKMELVSSEFDWSKVRERVREGYAWASVRGPALRGGTVEPP